MNKEKIQERVLDIVGRSQVPLDEGSITAIFNLEKEIDTYKALVELLLRGELKAEYNGDVKQAVDINKFTYKMTDKGHKATNKLFKEKSG